MIEKSGIYAIVHKSSGRRYIGSASNISKRWHRHKKDLLLGIRRNAYLQSAWNKYGAEAFEFVVLELTSDLTVREQYWLDFYRAYENGFNGCPVARSSRGRKVGQRQRDLAKMRMLNFQHLRQTPEARAARIAKRRGDRSLGQRLTWEQVCAIREKYGTPTNYGKERKQAHKGGVTLKKLADEYGIGTVTIYDVMKWKTWKTDPNS